MDCRGRSAGDAVDRSSVGRRRRRRPGRISRSAARRRRSPASDGAGRGRAGRRLGVGVAAAAAAAAGPAQRPRSVGHLRRVGVSRQRLGPDAGGGGGHVQLRRRAVLVAAQLVPARTSTRTALDSQYVSTQSSTLGQMVKCGPAGMRASSLGLVGLGFRVRYKVRVSVRDRVGVRVSDGVRFSIFTFCHTSSPQNPASPHARILPIAMPLVV